MEVPYHRRICILARDGLIGRILEDAHKSNFTVHPGISKMNQDLKKMLWWLRMKSDIAKFVNKCLVCQKMMINTRNCQEHCKPWRSLSGCERVFQWIS